MRSMPVIGEPEMKDSNVKLTGANNRPVLLMQAMKLQIVLPSVRLPYGEKLSDFRESRARDVVEGM